VCWQDQHTNIEVVYPFPRNSDGLYTAAAAATSHPCLGGARSAQSRRPELRGLAVNAKKSESKRTRTQEPILWVAPHFDKTEAPQIFAGVSLIAVPLLIFALTPR